LVAFRFDYLVATKSSYPMTTRLVCGWRILKIQLCRIQKSSPLLCLLIFLFKLLGFHYLCSNSFLNNFFSKFFLLFTWFICKISSLVTFSPFSTLFLHVKVHLCPMILVSTHMRTSMIGTSPCLFLALMEFEGLLFSYLENWTRLNCIGKGMRKGKKRGGDWCCF
jgi:hypothetical protein